MGKIPDEVRKQIEEGVKEIAKKSTAPDKETPDWMETDIRRGAEFGYSLASKALSDANKEIERLKGLLDEIASGQKMLVNRTGVGQYTVVFNSEDAARKYYEDDFPNNL